MFFGFLCVAAVGFYLGVKYKSNEMAIKRWWNNLW